MEKTLEILHSAGGELFGRKPGTPLCVKASVQKLLCAKASVRKLLTSRSRSRRRRRRRSGSRSGSGSSTSGSSGSSSRGVTLIQTKQKRAGREQRIKYNTSQSDTPAGRRIANKSPFYLLGVY